MRKNFCCFVFFTLAVAVYSFPFGKPKGYSTWGPVFSSGCYLANNEAYYNAVWVEDNGWFSVGEKKLNPDKTIKGMFVAKNNNLFLYSFLLFDDISLPHQILLYIDYNENGESRKKYLAIQKGLELQEVMNLMDTVSLATVPHVMYFVPLQ